jgi:hypothetical protein
MSSLFAARTVRAAPSRPRTPPPDAGKVTTAHPRFRWSDPGSPHRPVQDGLVQAVAQSDRKASASVATCPPQPSPDRTFQPAGEPLHRLGACSSARTGCPTPLRPGPVAGGFDQRFQPRPDLGTNGMKCRVRGSRPPRLGGTSPAPARPIRAPSRPPAHSPRECAVAPRRSPDCQSWFLDCAGGAAPRHPKGPGSDAVAGRPDQHGSLVLAAPHRAQRVNGAPKIPSWRPRAGRSALLVLGATDGPAVRPDRFARQRHRHNHRVDLPPCQRMPRAERGSPFRSCPKAGRFRPGCRP